MALICWTGSPREAHGLLSEHFKFNEVEHTFVHLNDAPLEALHRSADSEKDVILAMGSMVLKKYQAMGVVPKNRALGSQRGKVFMSPSGLRTLFTYDPTLIHHEADKPTEIIWDANLAARLMKHGTLKPQIGNYQWGVLQDVQSSVEQMLTQHGRCVLSLDLETHGLFPWYDTHHIVSSQWCWTPGEATVVNHYCNGSEGFSYPSEREAFEWLITEPRILLWGANLKFDSVWIREKWKLWIQNFTFDTTLAGSIQSENRSNSLNNHTKIYVPDLGGYDDEFNAQADKGEMPAEMAKNPQQFCNYAGGDGDACYQVGLHIQGELGRDHQLKRFYQKILHPAARAFEHIEHRGLLIDRTRMQEVKSQVEGDVVDLTHKTMMQIPLEVRAMHADNLKLSRPNLIRDTMFSPQGFGLHPKIITAKTKKPSTAMNHLKMFADNKNAKPFLDSLGDLNSATKTLSTYIDGFLTHLRPDGHFHPTYALHHGALFEGKGDTGTVSGRLTAKDPSINTLPKHTTYTKILRSCYPAPDGYDFWQLDYSQGELRVAAELAAEDNMIQVYLDGGDLHSKTAAELNGYSYDDFMALKISDPALYEKLRQGGKAGNFGLLYAMGAKGFVAYAYNQYGVVISLQDATKFRNNFLYHLYPRLPEWHEESIEHVRNFKQIRTPLGRLRHLPLIDSPDEAIKAKAERQAINSPVQSTLNDICLHLVGLIETRYGKDEHEFSVRGSSHDALYGYVRKGEHEKWFHSVQAIVDEQHEIFRTDFNWEPKLRFPIDWELGDRWDTLKKYNLSA